MAIHFYSTPFINIQLHLTALWSKLMRSSLTWSDLAKVWSDHKPIQQHWTLLNGNVVSICPGSDMLDYRWSNSLPRHLPIWQVCRKHYLPNLTNCPGQPDRTLPHAEGSTLLCHIGVQLSLNRVIIFIIIITHHGSSSWFVRQCFFF